MIFGFLVFFVFWSKLQETTATVLSAALASKKYEPSSSGPSTVSQPEQGSSSSASVPSTTMHEVVQSLESKPAVTSGMIEKTNDGENKVKVNLNAGCLDRCFLIFFDREFLGEEGTWI